jgi:hypothetical protein
MNGSYLSLQQKGLGTLRLLSLLSMNRTTEKASSGVEHYGGAHPGPPPLFLLMAMQAGQDALANREKEEVTRLREKRREERRERSRGLPGHRHQ